MKKLSGLSLFYLSFCIIGFQANTLAYVSSDMTNTYEFIGSDNSIPSVVDKNSKFLDTRSTRNVCVRYVWRNGRRVKQNYLC